MKKINVQNKISYLKINGEDYISMVATGDRIIIKLLYKHHFM